MNFVGASRKDIGNYGEKVARVYLERQGYGFVDKNVSRKTGELDIIMKRGGTMHFVEVKTMVCAEFPHAASVEDEYDPSNNLHEYKIRKVVRTAEWYVAEHDFEGEWQVDGALVWLRERDGVAKVTYLPQIA